MSRNLGRSGLKSLYSVRRFEGVFLDFFDRLKFGEGMGLVCEDEIERKIREKGKYS